MKGAKTSERYQDDLNLKDPNDLSHLSFGDKINILRRRFYGKPLGDKISEKSPEYQEKDLINKLTRINSLRNKIAHLGTKLFDQQTLSAEIQKVRDMMDRCNEFFKKYPGK